MKLSEFKTLLKEAKEVNFQLPNGTMVPEHFHVTEVGMITKKFIDCGGTLRDEKVVNFQLWNANDTDHRLKAEKLIKIISLSENLLGIEDSEIEVEYQGDTIGKYDLGFNGTDFLLLSKHTNCLAQDNCGVPAQKTKVNLQDLVVNNNCCTPNSGCC